MAKISITIKHNAFIQKWDGRDLSNPIKPIGSVKSSIQVQVDDLWTSRQVITYLIQNHLIPPNNSNSYVLIKNEDSSNEQVNEFFDSLNIPIYERGIHDGHILRLEQLGSGGGSIPYRTFREIQLVDAIIQENYQLNALENQVWFAIALYTEEDKELSNYIRQHIIELDEMTTPATLLFVLEQPIKEWNLRLKRLLGEIGQDYFYHLWYRFGEKNFSPIDKSQAYKVAKEFGLLPKDFPCIVIFRNLYSEEFIPIKLNNYISPNSATLSDYTSFFRILFSCLQLVPVDNHEAISKLNIKLNSEFIKRKLPTIQQLQLPNKKAVLDIVAFIAKLFGLI